MPRSPSIVNVNCAGVSIVTEHVDAPSINAPSVSVAFAANAFVVNRASTPITNKHIIRFIIVHLTFGNWLP